MSQTLALLGGPKAITKPLPHEVWPPAATQEELAELANQRMVDISIKGRTGIIKDFEEMFLDFLEHKMRHAVSFNSGTSALLAAYFAMGIDEGDEVIGPALTFHAALSPAFLLRANIVLADVRTDTRCIDAAEIPKLINERTRVITVVHQWGHPAEMDVILDVARKHSLMVLEDCSHAHGSRFKGRLCGTFGDAAVFSLQAAKMVYAGEGGILVTNNQRLYDRATLLGHFRVRSREDIADPTLQKYWVTGFGQKLRMSPLNAVVAKHALLQFPHRKLERHKCLSYFGDRLRGNVPYLDVPSTVGDVDMGAWYGFKPLYRGERLNRVCLAHVITALQAEGMEIARASAPVLKRQPLYAEVPDQMFPTRTNKVVSKWPTPSADRIERDSLSLPTFTNWESDRDLIDAYVEAFVKVYENRDVLGDVARATS